jgi:hypothetical protein
MADHGETTSSRSDERNRKQRRRLRVVGAIALATLAAAVARTEPAAALGYFSDGSFAGAQAACDGKYWSLQSLGGDYVRYWIYDHQKRRYVYTHNWIRSGFAQSGLPWLWGAGRFTVYAEYAKVVGGQWSYAGEFVGVLSWRTDIVYGQLFCWPY